MKASHLQRPLFEESICSDFKLTSTPSNQRCVLKGGRGQLREGERGREKERDKGQNNKQIMQAAPHVAGWVGLLK